MLYGMGACLVKRSVIGSSHEKCSASMAVIGLNVL